MKTTSLFFADFIDDQSNINPSDPKKLNPMNADPQNNPAAFLRRVSVALTQLKQRLQSDYEHAYPELAEIVHLVLDEEEARARQLSFFPHLLLPDLVEAHIATLNLRPVKTRREDVSAPHRFNDFLSDQPACAVCA